MPGTPDWQRVHDDIIGGIRTQRWARGGPLPTGDELAAEFGVSKATVNVVMRMLIKDGWVVGAPGRGRYVATDPPE